MINNTDQYMYIKGDVPGGSTVVKQLPPGQDAGAGRGYLEDVDAYTFRSTHFYVYAGSIIWIRRAAGYWQNIDDPYEATCERMSGFAPRCEAFFG